MSPYLNRVSLCVLAMYSYFLSILNVSSMAGFHPIGCQGIL